MLLFGIVTYYSPCDLPERYKHHMWLISTKRVSISIINNLNGLRKRHALVKCTFPEGTVYAYTMHTAHIKKL